jgi:hypothetical protein
MIITFENNNFDGDWCYSPNSNFSTIRFTKAHPEVKQMNIFNGRNILNWCIMSAPGHFFLERALESFVKLVRLEYIGLSNLKMNKHDKFSKHVYCTTGPSLLTAAFRYVFIFFNQFCFLLLISAPSALFCSPLLCNPFYYLF